MADDREVVENGVRGLCLDNSNEKVGDTKQIRVQVWGCHGNDNQRWDLDRDTGEIKQGDLCLDGFSKREGGDVVLWPCNGKEHQKWWRDGKRFRNGANHELCLDADARADVGNGTRVQLYWCRGDDHANQLWFVHDLD
ncbi:hypothetical protein ALI144C_27185 [Actinosynnema sp. ALI-1.44]|nr:hypothetical protein ALI144C_27185 [Actinosynnema sp. ALI-1.44]